MTRILRELGNVALIAAGILLAGMGLKGFLVSSNFIDGGVTGISMLLAKTTGLPLPAWLIAVNIPFVAIGYRQLGWAFATRSTLAITGLAVAVAVVRDLDARAFVVFHPLAGAEGGTLKRLHLP